VLWFIIEGGAAATRGEDLGTDQLFGIWIL
jgi:hypothetical protein